MTTVFAALLLALAPHDVSISSSRVAIDGPRIEARLRVQAETLLESVPILDADHDTHLSKEELELARAQLEAYLGTHYELFSNDAPTALPIAVVGAELVVEGAGTALEQRWVELALRCEAPDEIATLTLRSTLFVEANPLHSDQAEVLWPGDEPRRARFDHENPRFRFESSDHRRPGVWRDFYELGVEHILSGFDHLAFVLVLVLASLRLRSVLAVVTAFTLSHSLTLGLAALDLFHLPSRMVEIAIALSIAYVAAVNLLERAPRRLWIEAFLFGLLHGLGFAGALGDALLGEELKLSALFAFNLGVESGQIAVVCAAVLGLRLLPRAAHGEADAQRWLAPRWLRVGGSALVVLLGLYWFVERAWL